MELQRIPPPAGHLAHADTADLEPLRSSFMASRRGPVIGWSGTLAGLGIGAATLIATVGKKPLSNPWFIVSVVVAIVATAIFLFAGLPDLFSWMTSALHGARIATRRPQRLVADRWQYTAEGMNAAVHMSAFEQRMPGTSYMKQPGERLPWVRYVVLVGCSKISSEADGRQLWSHFESLLNQPRVTSLVEVMTDCSKGFTWTRWATTGTSVIDAILTSGGEDDVVASARLELPDDSGRAFRDARYATFILHFEPPRKDGKRMKAVSPDAWDKRMTRALELAQVLVPFLSAELHLTTSAEPPVNVGVKVDAQQDMAELIDITGMQPLPGATRRREAIGYFLADRDGSPAVDAARRMITHVLQYSLGVERSFS